MPFPSNMPGQAHAVLEKQGSSLFGKKNDAAGGSFVTEIML
jgi:hypothetical protein